MIKYQEAANYIQKQLKETPEIGLVLGSGLGTLASDIEDQVVIEYKDIPNFPVSTVEGHAGRLVIGLLEGKKVIAMQGRFHYYEGYSMQEVTFPIRVMKLLGVNKLVLTNAAGGLTDGLDAGSLMLITDHINFTGDNPLIGPNIEIFGPRFPDMSEAYSKEFINIAKSVAKDKGIQLLEGVYAGISGPNYASKAELRMLIKLGANAIGMSTVPEAIVATHAGMEILGISCITDSANPDKMHAPTHEEIVKVAEETRPKFIQLVKATIKEMV